jgi:hypothetical protein
MKRKRATLESAPPRDNRMRWENELSERTADEPKEARPVVFWGESPNESMVRLQRFDKMIFPVKPKTIE